MLNKRKLIVFKHVIELIRGYEIVSFRLFFLKRSLGKIDAV